jgi:hypothetical protein
MNATATQITAAIFATQTAEPTPIPTEIPPEGMNATSTRIAAAIFATQTAKPTPIPTETSPEEINATATRIAAAIFATQTAEPTPIPTETPIPTPVSFAEVGDTVISPNWEVKVLEVRTDSEFETMHFSDQNTTTHFVIITLEYTYLGSKTIKWSPEGIILVHTGERLEGWSRTPTFYQTEFSTSLTNFTEDVIFISARPQVPEIATLVYRFPQDFVDFRLYFPETTGVSITLDEADNSGA